MRIHDANEHADYVTFRLCSQCMYIVAPDDNAVWRGMKSGRIDQILI
jgi:hypothetical protein